MNDYINIGKFVATFGVKGELILQHALAKKTSLKNIEAVFIEEHPNAYLPYFIQSSKPKNSEEIFIKLEGVDTKETAQKFLRKKAWLRNEDFQKIAGKSSPIAFIGYQLINEKKFLGIIEEVTEQPHQILLHITINNKEVLIPLHEKTLIKIDKKKKEVHVILPDGLLDIYV
ncbi:MAG: ribosome maturation factor RimM [Chitinophagaceae bacterium]